MGRNKDLAIDIEEVKNEAHSILDDMLENYDPFEIRDLIIELENSL